MRANIFLERLCYRPCWNTQAHSLQSSRPGNSVAPKPLGDRSPMNRSSEKEGLVAAAGGGRMSKKKPTSKKLVRATAVAPAPGGSAGGRSFDDRAGT
jgi:hypothetical protein